MTADVTYRLTICPGGEPEALRFYEVLNADLEARDAAEAVSLSYYEDEREGWIVEVIGAEVPGLPVIRTAARKAFGDPTGFPPFSVARMPDIDWVAHSQQGLPPVRAGTFVVHGSHDRDRVHGRRLGIQIDAGQAFGTAHHGTTLGCLIALDWLSRLRPIENVLDVGTGTGVLAIAAAKRGAQVLATDVDETAVRVARANVELNGAAHAVTCLEADGLRHPAIHAGTPYHLVLANILAEPLMGMANDIRRVVAPGGVVVLSGILRNQGWRVTRRFNAAGFALWRRIERAGWTTLVMIRRRDLPAR
ncbi:50S ribosomal protein L11 methyltransferase [Dichotomicrobium thermohalophilum]|uniref:Ribosomal protein L11 methyltransferase n=1 Tax=Dichotomicrobium thermohalophilum TaxID=933063 RepID=A0A397Q3S8_9HYPH|nr:50S ribosomal protein L11 methyltransferase [Dichotomicrobium thermohalophilum]RIA55573.1 [LSU ribosomal protein L11P]-lysine N-methyltransferase [Dichotomicrobium thermohalophilum]